MSCDLVLPGCIPSVLAGYLKALAVHRLVAEQLDATALSYWDPDGRFHLVSSADRDALLAFFVERYEPTPIVTPWNGGSGFYPSDQRAGIDAIQADTSPRLLIYRETILRCRDLLDRLGIEEKPKDEQKQRLLEQARAWFPDEAVRWLDAVYVVGDSPAYPPILGTGGNDGRLDFANNFMQRVAELLLTPAHKRRSRDASTADKLRAAVLGEGVAGVYQDAAVGQFAPALVGGPNMGEGESSQGRVNAWDFVLALEGALLFAGAAVRRLDSLDHGKASFPFHVSSSAVGYGSSAAADADRENSRAELWLPLWPAPAGLRELEALFGEGRIELGRRRAASGLDAARALATLGVDRGIDRFARVAILKRNGLSFLATAQGTLEVRAVPGVELLRELDAFIAAALRLDNPGPAVAAALRALQAAMFEACRGEHRRLTDVLAAVGALERAVARSSKAHDRVRPLRRLSKEWLAAAADPATEWAIAAAVTSWRVRAAIEPVDENGRWDDAARPAWTDRDPLENIVAVARRRLMALDKEAGSVPLSGESSMTQGHLRRLLRGALDPRRLTDLVFGLSLVEGGVLPRDAEQAEPCDDAVFAVLRAVTSPWFLAQDGRHPSPRTIPAILGRLSAHDVDGALEIAERRLKASGRPPKAEIRQRGRRSSVQALAVALVIPLPQRLERDWLDRFIKEEENQGAPAPRPADGETP